MARSTVTLVAALAVALSFLPFVFATEQQGSISAWGAGTFGQTRLPTNVINDGFVAVAGGSLHSLALRSDGSIVGFGANTDGHGQYYGQSVVPEPNVGHVAISAGLFHSLGLKADGTIVHWGGGAGTIEDLPGHNADFRAIAAGATHSLGVKEDGRIVAWGVNDQGQCNVPDDQAEPNAGYVAAAGGLLHSLGLKATGRIVGWGNNSAGQLDVPTPNTNFVAIACGPNFNLGLRDDGTVAAWGNNAFGQCDVPLPNSDFVAISAGGSHSLGLKADGTVVAWGNNVYGQCTVALPNERFIALSAGGGHSLAIRRLPVAAAPDPPSQATLSYLRGATPNPFNPQTTIGFRVHAGGPVWLDVLDLRGRRERSLWHGVLEAGDHAVTWDGRNDTGSHLPSGVYLVQLRAPGTARQAVKLTLAR